MSNIQIFENSEFGQVRTIEEDGKILFCGSDVAKALGYAKPRNAISQHCKGALKQGIGVQTGIKTDGTPAMQNVEMNFIPEPDVYRLIVNSKLPAAEKFEKWVFEEVLPSIRKHGTYSIVSMTEYQRLMTMTRAENARIRKAQILTKLASQYEGTYRQVLHAHATKELTGEYLLPLPELPEKTYTATEIGERLGITANMVGILANRHNLKTEEYGKWFHDKAKNCDKEVQTFRYYENVIPVIQAVMGKTA